MILESNRLILRDYTENDLYTLHNFRQNTAISKYMHWENCTLEDTNKWFQIYIEDIKRDSRMHYHFLIEDKNERVVIGETGISIITINNKGGIGRLGFYLNPDKWGKGIIKEASIKVLDLSFNRLGLHKITADCESKNCRSISTLKSLGMKQEALFRKDAFIDNEWEDIEIYSILNNEFRY
jgi:ribosomal-protein-alanine N-acetyltransferase